MVSLTITSDGKSRGAVACEGEDVGVDLLLSRPCQLWDMVLKSWGIGVPLDHPNFRWGFSLNHPAIGGTPMTMETSILKRFK